MLCDLSFNRLSHGFGFQVKATDGLQQLLTFYLFLALRVEANDTGASDFQFSLIQAGAVFSKHCAVHSQRPLASLLFSVV